MSGFLRTDLTIASGAISSACGEVRQPVGREVGLDGVAEGLEQRRQVHQQAAVSQILFLRP
jgi:hypothetical protein